MMARAPEPKPFFPFEFGESRATNVGRTYERVFPVPVGEMAARSRFYADENPSTTTAENPLTHFEKDRNPV